MLVTRGYKYKLRVNNKERSFLTQCAGTARFAWNWGLTQRLEMSRNDDVNIHFTDAMKQHKTLNQLKKTVFNWMYKYSKCIPQEALRDLDRVVKNYRTGRKTGRKVGFPKFKKIFHCKDSFRLTGVIWFYSDRKMIQLPRLGRLRLEEQPVIPDNGRILFCLHHFK